MTFERTQADRLLNAVSAANDFMLQNKNEVSLPTRAWFTFIAGYLEGSAETDPILAEIREKFLEAYQLDLFMEKQKDSI